MLRVQIYKSGEPQAKFHLTADHLPTVIGRSEEAGVRIDDRAVSRKHAQLSLAGDKVVLTDLGSGNGTYLGDKAIETKVIDHKDEFTIGNYKLLFELESKIRPTKPASPYDSIPEDNDTEGMTMKMSKTEMKEVATRSLTEKPARLRQVDGDRVIPLRSNVCFIGSSPVCDIIVKGWGIAPKHALVMKDGANFRLYDLTGKKKVLVKDEGIDDMKLRNGVQFAVGKKNVFTFEEGEAEEQLTETYKEWFKE